MGKRGPLASPNPSRSSHSRKRSVAIAPVRTLPVRVHVPLPPRGLLPSVRRAWRTFWTSELRDVIRDVDRRALERLFKLYDQHERTMEAAEAAILVKGSVGQLRLNPAWTLALKLEDKILRLENEFGLTPMARARLGLKIGMAGQSLADLKKAAQEAKAGEVDVREHAVAPDDPRLAAVVKPPRDS